MSNLRHFGFISYTQYDGTSNGLIPYYTTGTNEIIQFKDKEGNVRELNSLFINAPDSDLYIIINPLDDLNNNQILYIPSGESFVYDYRRLSSIQIIGNGLHIRYYGNWE
ncbi:hypothetical protein [Clostridium sp.]|uniref:hypothetical protein n=1 Tax=Clostridium sp. TaxID=1506 RepID=UPI002606126E|nr:hypothetical protein [Clostridium sp.]